MARLRRQTRETIKIVIAVLIVGVVLFFYVIYPLNKVQSMWGRNDSAPMPDSTTVNDPSPFLEAGLTADTFHIDVDAMTKLACLYVKPQVAESAQLKGTVLLIHSESQDRSALAGLGKALLDSGYAVSAFDQRASGLSTGKYHSDGQLEATDMEALVAYLDIRGKIVHPFVVVGYEIGADAAINASREESRINRVVAVGPHLATSGLVAHKEKLNSPFWFPFRSGIFWWWYRIRSGYAISYLEADSVRAAGVPTVILMPSDRTASEELKRFDQLSADTLVTIEPLAGDSAAAEAQVISAVVRK